MAAGPQFSQWTTSAVFLLVALTAQIHGLAINYCSPDNTNSNYPTYSDQYMANGECGTHCQQEGFIYAVMQGYNCWCSNYVPARQVNTLTCNQVCPGYGSEWCGSTSAGLYGYYQVNSGNPSGTLGGVSSAASTSSSTVSRIVSRVSSSSPSIRASPSSSPSASSPSSSSSATPSTTPTPEVFTSVTTVTGQIRTVLITPSPTVDSTLGQSSTEPSRSGVSTGKVVGAVVGAALGLALLVGFIVWFCLRKRHQKRLREGSPDLSYSASNNSGPSNNGIPSRQVSQMSSAGLLGKTPRIMTHGIAPGHDPRSADTNSAGFDRRSMGTDQRLNPHALYIHDESRMSDVSLQDNQDYSRQLRVANPDL